MNNLNGAIALVTGASRGVGKGVALALAEAGATVYATGRTVSQEGFLESGRIIPIRCDHTNDQEVEAVFRQIVEEQVRFSNSRFHILMKRETKRRCFPRFLFLVWFRGSSSRPDEDRSTKSHEERRPTS